MRLGSKHETTKLLKGSGRVLKSSLLNKVSPSCPEEPHIRAVRGGERLLLLNEDQCSSKNKSAEPFFWVISAPMLETIRENIVATSNFAPQNGSAW